ncbi:MAG: hypothetical protein KDB18_13460, partial [Salinibacterium sp.]|nr:hypothetical protein [Salinibacterium sp.]
SIRGLEVCGRRDDGQYEYTAIAQFFNVVNDRLMLFRRGSFAKTIAESVTSGSGRVKINDGHKSTSRDTLGTVIEAREEEGGVFYRGLISSTEGEIFTKMQEGHVDENSIEFFSIQEGATRVPMTDIPTGAWIWDHSTGDGTVEVREITEVAWVGIAILPYSSQGRRALLEVNCAIPYQDLPVASASTAWDPVGAAERLRKWAGISAAPGKDPHPNFSRLARGFLVRGPIRNGEPILLGQIADVVDGELVVVPDALDAALESLSTVREVSGPDIVACSRVAGRYTEKLRRGSALAPAADREVASTGNAGDPAGPAPETSGITPPTDDARSDEATDLEEHLMGRTLQLMSLRLESLATRYPEVLRNESAGASRQLPQRGRAAVRGASGEAR